ncbi:hypothetical protein Tco_1450584 [Tanacetum coccineum]
MNLDYKTFCETTRLDYNKGDYVAHPSPEVVKAKLTKIATNEALVQKTLVIKTSFPVAWRILLTFVIHVLDENHSSTKQLNSIQQLIVFSLLTRTKIDIGEIIFSDLVTRLMAKSRQRYVFYPRFISLTLLPYSKKKRKKKTQTGTRSSKPLPEGKLTDVKDLGETNNLLTSSEVEVDSEPLILATVRDIQALLGYSKDELKDVSDEEMLEAGEELDEEFLQSANKETQHPYSTEIPTQ